MPSSPDVSREDRLVLVARIDGDGDAVGSGADACVPWWSFTKTVLATAALKLVAQGLCDLDARVDGEPFTLRQLLQHRAGVPNYGGLAAYHDAVRRGDAPWSTPELLQRVDSTRLDFVPGHGWNYSNVGYLYVRQIIERTTGQDIEDALRQLVLDPLGLGSVRLAREPSDLVDTAWGNAGQYHPEWVYHGLLVGTPRDALHLLHALVSGRVLPDELLTQMLDAYVISRDPMQGRPWLTAGYGLGLMIGETIAGRMMGHTGGGPGSVCAVYHFAHRGMPCTVAAFAEGDDAGVVEDEVVRQAGAVS